MKYRITLNGKVYEIEVERGEALVTNEYPAPATPVSNVYTSASGRADTPTQTASVPVSQSAPNTSAAVPSASSAQKEPDEAKKASAPAEPGKQNSDLLNSSTPDGGEKIKAPLPGTVIDISVSVGDRVTKGKVLLVLEAMKMENEIVSPVEGIVKQIITSKGASVNNGDPLMIIA